MDKIYTQADMDAAIEKTRSETSTASAARYKDQSGTIENLNKQLADLNTKFETVNKDLATANSELFQAKEMPAIKEEYKKLGGNEDFFNDFMKIHGESFTAEGAKKEEVLKGLVEGNKHYFTQQAPTPEQVQAAKLAGEPIGGGDPAGNTTPDFKGKGNPYV